MDERTARAFQWLKGLCDIEFGTPDGEAMEKIYALVLSLKGDHPTWIPITDRLPDEGQSVAFVCDCENDKNLHGRILGGRYMPGKYGGFSVPGLMVNASHWFAMPPLMGAVQYDIEFEKRDVERGYTNCNPPGL